MKTDNDSSILLIGVAAVLLGPPIARMLPAICEGGFRVADRIVTKYKESSRIATAMIEMNRKVGGQAFREAEKVAFDQKPRPKILVEVGRFGRAGDKLPLFGRADFFSCRESDQFVYLFETRTQPPGPIYSYRSCCRIQGEAVECHAFKI